VSWLIAKQFASGQLDLWFEPFQTPTTFGVTLTYANGTTDSVTGIAFGLSTSTPAPTPTPSPGTVTVLPGQPLPLRQWVERPLPAVGQAYMAGNGGKHGRTFYHPGRKGMVFAGGDWHTSQPQYDGSGDFTGSEIWHLNALTDNWTLLRPFCVPNQPMPGHPDTVAWAYDAKRDQAYMAPGFYGITQGYSSGCGAIEGWGGYTFSFATKQFTGPDAAAGLLPPPGNWGGDTVASYAVFDPTNDELCRIRNGPALECFNVGAKTWRVRNLGLTPTWNPIPNRAQSVIDVQGRAIYFLDAFGDAGGVCCGGTFPPRGPALIKVSLVDGSVTTIALPAQYTAPSDQSQEVYLVFDPVNRLVLVPDAVGMGTGPLTGLGIYHVDTRQWEWEATPPAAYGSVWGFDENVGAMIGIGKRQPGSSYYLYKYK